MEGKEKNAQPAHIVEFEKQVMALAKANKIPYLFAGRVSMDPDDQYSGHMLMFGNADENLRASFAHLVFGTLSPPTRAGLFVALSRTMNKPVIHDTDSAVDILTDVMQEVEEMSESINARYQTGSAGQA